jgi:DNA (cytosine-5)-methyltransferase 1
MVEKITVAELFAGVGGFRLGLEGNPNLEEDTGFKVVFSNQWEPPGNNRQWASEIYQMHFGNEGHNNQDIHDIACHQGELAGTINKRIDNHDLLVGGFPCQDYSVARTISGELGIKGEKGKLWVPIRNIIRHKRPRPKVILLENVPRLLNSPAKARGLNFAIILNDLISMGYEVEWRVINAAEYGMPQQRRRVFILAYRTPNSGQLKSINGPEKYGSIRKTMGPMSKWLLGKSTSKDASEWKEGPFSEAFPLTGEMRGKPELISQNLETYSSKSSPFGNAGYAWKKAMMPSNSRKPVYWSIKNINTEYDGKRMVLGDVIEKTFSKKYEVDTTRIDEWEYAKGSKKEFRIRKKDRGNVNSDLLELYDRCMSAPFKERAGLWTDYRSKFIEAIGNDKFYHYDEGAMVFDLKEKASRTVVTAEIGTSPSRMRHIFFDSPEKLRRLSPIETERLNMFPDNWTMLDDIKDSRRGFLMGNALVVGVIERLREPLRKLIAERRL